MMCRRGYIPEIFSEETNGIELPIVWDRKVHWWKRMYDWDCGRKLDVAIGEKVDKNNIYLIKDCEISILTKRQCIATII